MNMCINSIKYNNSLVDGPGIRTVLFMQGCDIRCVGCQNSSTWEIAKGQQVNVKELSDELINKVFNKKITISGGEPLVQKEALFELVILLYQSGFDIALYTGHQKKDVPKELLNYITYLKTGSFIQELQTTIKPYVGSTNQKFERIKSNETVK